MSAPTGSPSDRGFDDLVRLGKLIDATPRPSEQLDELRTAILAGAPARPPVASRRVVWTGVLCGCAVAAALALYVVPRVLGGGGPAPTGARQRPVAAHAHAHAPVFRAEIAPQPGAAFSHQTPQPDEQIRLADGTLAIEVAPLAADQRVRVMVGDAEVESRGAGFDVVVARDRLVSVAVRRGRVEIRPSGRPAVFLASRERWDASTTSTGANAVLAPPAPRRRPARFSRIHPASVEPPPAAPRATAPPAERAYEQAWRALRGGDPADAAAEFERAVAADRDGALAEDATFWGAVALGRAGRSAGATRALTRFLARYPASPRAEEASAMLGWLLLDDGDLEAAEARFAVAVNARAQPVRDSARAGLREISHRRARHHRH